MIYLMTSMLFLSSITAKSSNDAHTTFCVFEQRSRPQRLIFGGKSASGGITSPSWPSTYQPRTAACRIAFNMEENYYIDFGFEEMSLTKCTNDTFRNYTALELERRCGNENGCDYILIKDGPKADDIHVFSGFLTGRVHVTRTNQVTLLFCSSKTDSDGIRWKISYDVREKGGPKSCYYSMTLRHTCSDGRTCTDSLKDCAIKKSLYPSEKPPSHEKDRITVGIIGSVLFFSLVGVCGLLMSGSLRRLVKYLKHRYRTSKYVITENYRGVSIEVASEEESECSEDINSQGRDILNPLPRSELPSVGYKETINCSFLDPWGHY